MDEQNSPENAPRHKKGIVALFAVLAVLCALLSRKVKVDYNMMHYLPKDAPSTIALDVMEEEYSAKTANCRIMIEDAAIPEALALKKQLQQVPGVSEVMWLDDYANVYAPLETLDGRHSGKLVQGGKRAVHLLCG